MPTTVPAEVDTATVIDWMTDPDAVTVLDVRDPAEFETIHIAGSYNVPLDNLHVLKTGVPGFTAAGGQAVHGRPRWALERQVRLVAGGLVLAGVLGSRWAPKSVLLAAGIGAGLTASALTDTCTVGRLLSALPHDRGAQPDAQQLLDRLPTPEPAAM
jgi:hypothetical protein